MSADVCPALARRGLLAAVLAALLMPATLAQTAVNSGAKLGTPSVNPAVAPQPDPGTLFAFSGSVGQILQFSVLGSLTGAVWGDGLYTSDSVLAAAAVHAGMLEPGQSGIVSVEIVKGLDAYVGVERNGVVSRSYSSWDVAYRFSGVAAVSRSSVLPDPGDLSGFRGQNGVKLTFEVTGAADGAVWGDGIYTDDSRLGAAAVHAGLLQPGQTGLIEVEIMAGQESYAGAERNGIMSNTYPAWPGSFRLAQISSKAAGKLSN